MVAEQSSVNALHESPWPKLTPYRLTNLSFTLVVIIVKGVLGYGNNSTLTNTLDFILGIGGVILFCVGYFEDKKNRRLTWFFEEDYLSSFHLRRRVPAGDSEASVPLVGLRSEQEGQTTIVTSPRDIVDTSGLRRRARWQRTEFPDDLNDSLERHRESVETTPRRDTTSRPTIPPPDRIEVPQPAPSTQLNQGWAQINFDQPISACRLVLELEVRSDRPGRYISRNHLASALLRKFDEAKTHSDLDEAISLYRNSLDETPWGHPDRIMNLTNVATALQTCFEDSRNLHDLDGAIFKFRSTLESYNSIECSIAARPVRFWNLTNLANALLTRFEHVKVLADLDESISHHRAALSLAESDHLGSNLFDHPLSLHNFSNALLVRFQHGRDWNDLEKALSSNRAALNLTPEGHSDRPLSLNNLASTLLVLFEEAKDSADLEEAVSSNRMALELTPEGHPYRSGSLKNLAKALLFRFNATGDLLDLDECIRNLRCVLSLTPSNHADRPTDLKNLATALLARFNRSQNPKELREAEYSNQIAMSLMPVDIVMQAERQVRPGRTTAFLLPTATPNLQAAQDTDLLNPILKAIESDAINVGGRNPVKGVAIPVTAPPSNTADHNAIPTYPAVISDEERPEASEPTTYSLPPAPRMVPRDFTTDLSHIRTGYSPPASEYHTNVIEEPSMMPHSPETSKPSEEGGHMTAAWHQRNLDSNEASERLFITVTADAEKYSIVDITSAINAAYIRDLIFSKLYIPGHEHDHYSIFRTELGEVALGDAVSDDQLLVYCVTWADNKGTLKFLVQRTQNDMYKPSTQRHDRESPVANSSFVPPDYMLPPGDGPRKARPKADRVPASVARRGQLGRHVTSEVGDGSRPRDVKGILKKAARTFDNGDADQDSLISASEPAPRPVQQHQPARSRSPITQYRPLGSMTPISGRPGADSWQNAPEGFLPPHVVPDHFGNTTSPSDFDRDFKTPRTIFDSPFSDQSSIYDPMSSPLGADLSFTTPGPMPETLPDWGAISPNSDALPFIPAEAPLPYQHSRNPPAESARVPRPRSDYDGDEENSDSAAYFRGFPGIGDAPMFGKTPGVSVQDIPYEEDLPLFPTPQPL